VGGPGGGDGEDGAPDETARGQQHAQRVHQVGGGGGGGHRRRAGQAWRRRWGGRRARRTRRTWQTRWMRSAFFRRRRPSCRPRRGSSSKPPLRERLPTCAQTNARRHGGVARSSTSRPHPRSWTVTHLNSTSGLSPLVILVMSYHVNMRVRVFE